MLDVLLLAWGATLALLALLLVQRYRLEAMRWELDHLRLNLDRPGPEPQRFAAVGNKGGSA
jgi:hypothetical protein